MTEQKTNQAKESADKAATASASLLQENPSSALQDEASHRGFRTPKGPKYAAPRGRAACRVCAFFFLAAVLLAAAYRVLSWKDTSGNFISSYEELYRTPKNTVDIAFLGSSHCYAGIYPAVLWEDRGITSFSMSVSGQDKDSCYHALVELEKTQHPQVVFVDLYALTFEEHAVIGNVYRNLLSMRPSANSAKLVADYADPEDREDFLLRWPIVHTRYRELAPYDFLEYPLNRFGRGASYLWEHTDVTWNSPCTDESIMIPVSESNLSWLSRMEALARKDGFTLVYLILPYDISEEDRGIFNGVKEYASENGIDVIDFSLMEEEIGLDRREDFHDQGHLSGFGAAKITRYLESWLDTLPAEVFLPVDRRADPSCEQWNQDLAWLNQTKFRYALEYAESAGEFCALLSQTTDITAVISLEDTKEEADLPDSAATLSDLLPALKPLGFNTAIASSGGKWLYRSGELTKLLPNDSSQEGVFQDLGPVDSLRVQYNGDFAAGNIMIGLTDYSHKDRRLQIVLYDNLVDEVIGAYAF